MSTDDFTWSLKSMPFSALIISGDGQWRSGDDLLHEFTLDVGKAIVAAAVTICQALMVQPQLVQYSRVEVMDVHRLIHGLEAEIVSRPVDVAFFESAACNEV